MRVKRKFILFGLLIACLWAGGVLRADREETLNKLRLTAEQVPGLGALTSEYTYSDEDIHSATTPPPDLDILREYGFVQRVVRTYASSAGEIRTTVDVMKDFKAAFGLYTHLKMPGGKTARVGDGSIGTANEIVFWQSNYCVHIQGPGAPAQALIQRVAQTLSQGIPHHSDVPVLVTYLPETGLHSKSVRYVLGFKSFQRYWDLPGDEAALGFKNNAEAIIADYTVGRSKGKILLLGYPNHPLAIQHYKALDAALQAQKSEGTVHIKRAGVIVGILTGDFDSATVGKVLDEITYADSVRWIYDKRGLLNRVSADYSALPILKTVVSSLLFTAMLCLTSLSAGLLVGGLRFYSRRFREQPLEETNPVMIRLNLSGR